VRSARACLVDHVTGVGLNGRFSDCCDIPVSRRSAHRPSILPCTTSSRKRVDCNSEPRFPVDHVHRRGHPAAPTDPATAPFTAQANRWKRLRTSAIVADGARLVVSVPCPEVGLHLTQPTISHHLKILVDAGIFTRDKRDVWAYYALVPSVMDSLSEVLSTTR
jgi:ArsR family transcriptional regulator, arsenate/arsenite/antimonite-responsive transcriptional repressor